MQTIDVPKKIHQSLNTNMHNQNLGIDIVVDVVHGRVHLYTLTHIRRHEK